LRRALAAYMRHCHEVRNDHELGNRMIRGSPEVSLNDASTDRRTWLGGMFTYCYRVAA